MLTVVANCHPLKNVSTRSLRVTGHRVQKARQHKCQHKDAESSVGCGPGALHSAGLGIIHRTNTAEGSWVEQQQQLLRPPTTSVKVVSLPASIRVFAVSDTSSCFGSGAGGQFQPDGREASARVSEAEQQRLSRAAGTLLSSSLPLNATSTGPGGRWCQEQMELGGNLQQLLKVR